MTSHSYCSYHQYRTLVAPAWAAHNASIPLPVPTSSTRLPANNSALSMMAEEGERADGDEREDKGAGVKTTAVLQHNHAATINNNTHASSRRLTITAGRFFLCRL